MWLARQMRSAPPTADADMGVTTIAGDRVGVLTRGEVRELPVYGPGLSLIHISRAVPEERRRSNPSISRVVSDSSTASPSLNTGSP